MLRRAAGAQQRETVMTIEALWLVIGAVAGWLAGQIVKAYGFGLVGNIVVGIIGLDFLLAAASSRPSFSCS